MPDNDRTDRLLEEAENALVEGNPEEALDRAEEVLATSPKDGLALLLKAEALYSLEEDEDADEAVEKALRAHPDDVLLLVRAAGVTLNAYGEDVERVEESLGYLSKAEKLVKRGDDPMLPSEIARLMGRAFSLMDDLESSAKAFEKARSLAGEAAEDELLVELAIAWFELCRFDDAKKALESVEKRDSDHPDVAQYLGLIAERAGDEKRAEKYFAKARRLDPEMYPTPIHLSSQEFDEVVEAALAKVPEPVRKALENVPVVVEAMPKVEDLKGPPALSPLSVGMIQNHRGPGMAATPVENELPGAILLFQKNLERYAASKEDLVEQIEVTLLHEIGHFVGWDEDELYDRGLH